MEIKTAKFVTSVASADNIKDFGVDEIAVAGRSNVGKSSFINYLTGRKGLAKTSSTPGKTRLLNYFSVNDGQFMLVDLPGYGFAVKLSDDERRRWDALMGTYLTSSPRLKLVLVLMDIRREPSELDKQMVSFLAAHIVPFAVVLTKADKLKKSEIEPTKQRFAELCEGYGCSAVILTSSEKGTGIPELQALFEQCLQQGETADGV